MEYPLFTQQNIDDINSLFKINYNKLQFTVYQKYKIGFWKTISTDYYLKVRTSKDKLTYLIVKDKLNNRVISLRKNGAILECELKNTHMLAVPNKALYFGNNNKVQLKRSFGEDDYFNYSVSNDEIIPYNTICNAKTIKRISNANKLGISIRWGIDLDSLHKLILSAKSLM